jgi:hypothetical protein
LRLNFNKAMYMGMADVPIGGNLENELEINFGVFSPLNIIDALFLLISGLIRSSWWRRVIFE